MTTTSGPAWWASAFGTIIDGAGAVWVPAGCYDLCTLFKADSDFGSCSWWCRILLTYLSLKFERWVHQVTRAIGARYSTTSLNRGEWLG